LNLKYKKRPAIAGLFLLVKIQSFENQHQPLVWWLFKTSTSLQAGDLFYTGALAR
jgi:hypothetical protein